MLLIIMIPTPVGATRA